MDEPLQGMAANPLSRIPVEITISVGRAHPTVSQLLSFQQDTIVALDRSVSDPVEIFIGDRLIARGELQEVEGDQSGQLAVRLTEVADLDKSL